VAPGDRQAELSTGSTTVHNGYTSGLSLSLGKEKRKLFVHLCQYFDFRKQYKVLFLLMCCL